MLLCVLVPAAQALRSLLRRWRARPLTMRSECDVLVKFGGSAVTVKASFEKLNEASLASAAAAVASGGRKAVLIHGAGSFGHFQAREHSVSKGTAAPGFSWRGFGLTRASVCKLNGHVVSALLEAGVAAVGMPPFPTWVTRGKGVVAPAATAAGLDRVRAALAAGLCAHPAARARLLPTRSILAAHPLTKAGSNARACTGRPCCMVTLCSMSCRAAPS